MGPTGGYYMPFQYNTAGVIIQDPLFMPVKLKPSCIGSICPPSAKYGAH